jgi:hypothetical protein
MDTQTHNTIHAAAQGSVQSIRRIIDLENGEAAHAPTHAAWVSGDRMYLNGNYPIKDTGGGSFGLRIIKGHDGRLLVDLSDCLDERFAGFSSFASFAGQVTPMAVDEALPAPKPDPDTHRIVDMEAGETAYIDPAAVWVYEGRRMWLNGYTEVSDSLSGRTPLRLQKLSDGSYTVDLSYCEGFEWASEPDSSVPQFPLQVWRRVA